MSAFNSFNVVDNYKSNLKQTNEQLVDKFFNDQIVAKSKINQQANEELANEIYALDKRIHKEQKIINLNRFGMIFMRCLSVVLFIIGVVFVCCNI
jgi:autonomous glycyl radical cofactor GrcA